MTPAINLLPVSLTPAINSFHRFSVFDGVVDNGHKFIAGDNKTSDKFTAGDKNKDAMGVGSFQGWEKVEGDKSAIFPAVKVIHVLQWCHWNSHEKLHP
jgi:hypothetical protein